MSLMGQIALPTGYGVNTPASVSAAILASLDGALSSAASQTRALATRFQDRASVLDYPVPVDGVTPAASAFQAALNDCAGQRELLVPFGTNILLDGPVNIPANTVLVLNGQLSKSPIATGFNTTQYSQLRITGSNVTIIGRGTIDGNLVNQGGAHAIAAAGIVTWYGGANLYGPNAGQTLFSNIYISGITIQNTFNWPISIVAQNSLVENCLFTVANSSPQISGSQNTHFVNCSAININDDGLGLYGGNNFCSVRGCTVTGSACGPFILSDGSAQAPNTNCALIDNIVSGNANAGIFVSGLNAYGGGVNSIQLNILVKGNQCTDNRTAGDFDINCVSNCLVTGNITQHTTYPGITVGLYGQLNNVKVSGNIFAGHSDNAILKLFNDPAEGNSGVVISDNMFIDSGTGDLSTVAMLIQCTGSSSYVTLRNNDVMGNIYAVYTDSSATPALTFEGTNAPNNVNNQKGMTQGLVIAPIAGSGSINLEPTGNAVFTGQVNAGVLTATGNIIGAAGLVLSGTASVGALTVSGIEGGDIINATGQITGGGFSTSGTMSAGSAIYTSGAVSATGNVTGGGLITSGTASAEALSVLGGTVVMSSLPTADPHHAGQIYISGGVLVASNG